MGFGLAQNKKSDILWLVLHRAVRVRYSIKLWGYISDDKCAICGRVETIEHCFLECHRVVRVWGHFSPHISTLLCSPFSVSVFEVSFLLCVSLTQPLSNYLIATVLYWIWHARNLATFRNSTLSSQATIRLIVKHIKLRIRCASSDAVKNFWSKDSVLCSIDDNDNIVFVI